MTANKPGSSQSNNWLQRARNWFFGTPERALEQAYIAACNIRKIEEKYFNGNKIAVENASHGEQTFAYFQSELKRNLKTAKIRLREFRSSRGVVSSWQKQQSETIDLEPAALPGDSVSTTYRDPYEIVLEKLQFIDEIIDTYKSKSRSQASPSPPPQESESETDDSVGVSVAQNGKQQTDSNAPSDRSFSITPQKRPTNTNHRSQNSAGKSQERSRSSRSPGRGKKSSKGSFSDRTSFMPRSILRTINRIKRELDPEAEEEVIENFRSSKTKTVISLKFIILLILIPLLTHQVAKTFVVGPIVEEIRDRGQTEVFLNVDMEEEAYMELQRYEERIKFESLIGQGHRLSDREVEEKVNEKAHEIAEKYRQESSNAIKNIFADLCAFAAFGMVLFRSQREISVLKSFMDDLVYGLSDSAKAFIIILFTDMFVGFHSPHGWEVILEGISRHLGLPESREFIFLFIATFPVILDTVFKYWIFRYLNRISPSAVATYRNMNE
ncbi:proton extrusion protein PcxA [Geitlerinema sp. PCC 9228]|jgi:hypothetical protein|uniref:proton extrusion protein PcxA n=1 Tax=Geitlerinema sp. PCC 9228 TaxID=111611 RepID=UPI0008F9B493|nr:proton extrusion protein PcxA [Geitlerinema sp. PCC 9228]